jgi:hypothetical protein
MFFMLNRHNPFVRYKFLFISFSCIILILFLSSCSSDMPLSNTVRGHAKVSGIKYSIVCIIHGDGDYLYHDTSNNEIEADRVTLSEVKQIAQQNPHAEVFIFHQKPTKHFLFFFPMQDGKFYYYRNGRLIANESYWRNKQLKETNPEVDLFKRFHVANQDSMIRFFMYFGHEIPEFGGKGYDASYPDRMFNINDLAVKLKGFTSDSSIFNLIILSTCFGGTPFTISTLGAYSRTIIASPDNLYLSYFNLNSLNHLDLSLSNSDIHSFAKKFARQAFDKLSGEIQTAVSVAVYSVDSVQAYLHSVLSIYNKTLTALKNGTNKAVPLMGHCDCAEIPEYDLPAINKGVIVFYRPARFGRLKHKLHHSGWECWRGIKLPGTALQTNLPAQK